MENKEFKCAPCGKTEEEAIFLLEVVIDGNVFVCDECIRQMHNTVHKKMQKLLSKCNKADTN